MLVAQRVLARSSWWAYRLHAMSARRLAIASFLPLLLVGCSHARAHPSSGPVDEMAGCPAYESDAPQPPSQVVGLKAVPRTVHVHIDRNGATITPPAGTIASAWTLVVVSGGNHICRDTDTFVPPVLARLEPTSAGTVVLSATNDTGASRHVTLIFR
jgi:hypothetical protein